MSGPRRPLSRRGPLYDRWLSDLAARCSAELLLGAALGELRNSRGVPAARRHLAQAASVLGEATR